jgi:hypothetical protein
MQRVNASRLSIADQRYGVDRTHTRRQKAVPGDERRVGDQQERHQAPTPVRTSPIRFIGVLVLWRNRLGHISSEV